MNSRELIFVFRKPNKGNFSIEKVYDSIFKGMKIFPGNPFTIKKKTLKKNYDFVAFLVSFISSLFSKKHIVHITGGCNYMVLAFPFKTRVLTIHDLFHFNKMKGVRGYIYDWFYYHLPIRFSNYVVVVSENTKNELVQAFSILENKVEVLDNPLVIPLEHIKYRKRSFSKEVPIKVLQIGGKPLKNYTRLIEATKDMNVFYHFVHANPKRIEAIIKEEGIEHCSQVDSRLSDEKMYALYLDCDVLFFASEAEGFGLPIIEGQTFGISVITSNISPMSEVGVGTIQVDPLNVDSIREGFMQLFNTEKRIKNAALSIENVKKYEAKTVANNYLMFYKSLI